MVDINRFLEIDRRLDTVIRFGAKTRIKDESVAEHSFHTSLYAMIMADIEEMYGNKVDKEKLLKTAILHDLEEAMTGDIIYSFKHGDTNVAKEIKRFSSDFFKNIVCNLPDKLSKEYTDLWENSKDTSTIEGRIIEAADKLEGLLYSMREVSLGNKSFENVVAAYIKQLKTMKLKSVEMILEKLKI